MRAGIPKILVTGGAGFIGSAFVRNILTRQPSLVDKVVVVDKLTYAGDLKRLDEARGKYKFYKADICDKKRIEAVMKKENPQILINFAAETHVDRSILDSTAFIQSNIMGTQVLMDLSRKYRLKRFIQISTDEVYGDIAKGSFTEESVLKPNSPYAASKAAADLLIKSYVRTYKFPAIIIRPCNNYGPWQYPEKLIPLAVLKILKRQKIPVYAKGRNVREWLYVDECVEGIRRIMLKGKIGNIYNLGSRQEKQNIEVVKLLLEILRQRQDMIVFVKDRPGHDLRYSLDSGKVFKEINWKPKLVFKDGLRVSLEWFLIHKHWLLSK